MAQRKASERELETGVRPEASWHDEYRDSAHVYVGGIATGVTEAQLRAAFSQYGRVVRAHMPIDASGRSRSYAFVTYEQPQSAVLAVDNLAGVIFYGRALRVDHARAPGERSPGKPTDRVAAILGEDPTGTSTDGACDLADKRQAVMSSMPVHVRTDSVAEHQRQTQYYRSHPQSPTHGDHRGDAYRSRTTDDRRRSSHRHHEGASDRSRRWRNITERSRSPGGRR